jgi:TPR repeat protein
MKRLIITLCFTVILAFGNFGVGWSGDCEKGFLELYKKGDYATAYKELEHCIKDSKVGKEVRYYLGHMFHYGEGVIKNDCTAAAYYKMSADAGYAPAQNQLFVLWAHGHCYGQRDFKIAKYYVSLAAEQGYGWAQSNLAGLYTMGYGVIEDLVYAHMWYNLAASNGVEVARNYKDEITKNMTPTQIEKAQDLARECVKKDYKGC